MTCYLNYYTKLIQETTVVQKLKICLVIVRASDVLPVPLHTDTILEIIRDCYETTTPFISVLVQPTNITNRMNKGLFVFSCDIDGLRPMKRVERQLLL